MSPSSVPVAMVLAVTFYVGAYHLWLHLRRPRKTDLYFAATCGAMVLYDFASFFLYNSASITETASWQRWQYVALGLLGFFFIHLFEAHEDFKRPRWIQPLVWLFPAASLVAAVERRGFLLTGDPDVKTLHGPLGNILLMESETGPLFRVLEGAMPLLVGYLLWASFIQRRESKSGAIKRSPLLAAAVVMCAALTHDALLERHLLNGMYLAEYGWFGVLLLMSWTLSGDLVDAGRVKKTLAATEERYAKTIDSIQDAVITTHTNGTILHLNLAAEKMLAVRLSAVEGAPLSHYVEFKSQETEAIVSDPVRFAVGRSPNPFGELPQMVTTDGNERRVDLGGTPLKGPNGMVEGAVVVIRDLTVQHNAIASLSHAKKMESIGQLAGGVAHDLNNLLTPILAYVELLQRAAAPASDEGVFLGYIQESAQRAAEVTKQLLALSRKQVLDVQILPLAELVRHTTPLLKQLVGEDIDLKFDLALDSGNVQVDPGQFEQVILNLATNARDAMPNGGSLMLRVKRISDTEISLEVRDSGAGMDSATVSRMFEPFFTTKPRGKGTGLGLASVRGIIEQHGGTLFVDSEPGEGTSIELVLPICDSGRPSSQASSSPSSAVERGSEVILAVEDDRSVRTLIQDALGKLGYTVHTADGLARAEALASSEPIDLLITDVVMPGADGPRVYETVRKFREIPCLYITGHADDRLGERGFVQKGIRVLRKPFTVTQLAARVRETLDHHKRSQRSKAEKQS